MAARRLRFFRQPFLACALGPSPLSTQKRPNHEHNNMRNNSTHHCDGGCRAIALLILLGSAVIVAGQQSGDPAGTLLLPSHGTRLCRCALSKRCNVVRSPPLLSSPRLSSPLGSLFKTYHLILQFSSPLCMASMQRVTRLWVQLA